MQNVIDDGPLPPHFPLSVTGNGQYRKKYQGRAHYFGAVSAGWKAALEKFKHDWEYILLGKTPPPMHRDGQPDPSTVLHIATEFISREAKRLERGQIEAISFTETRRAVEIAVTHLRPHTRVRLLTPADFADLRYALGFRWEKEGEGDATRWVRREGRDGVSILRKRVTAVRAMFRWAALTAKIIPDLPHYGDEFKTVSVGTLLKAARATDRKRGPKRWEVADVSAILEALEDHDQLRAAFLLSINCGFTAADCSALPWWAVDLEDGWIDFPRVKTGVDRPRLALWPETIEALRAVKALNLRPGEGAADVIVHQEKGENGEPVGEPIRLAQCVFIHDDGRQWVIRRAGERDANGVLVSESHRDRLGERFRDAIADLGVRRPGLGFATGRHTFESHGLRVADKELVDLVQGHSTGDMSQRYDHALDDDLRALADGVRRRLLPDSEDGTGAGGTGTSSRPRMRLAL